ncbi:MAG: DUF87 domain-containing protein [Planctomycetaceae bacterium]
MDPHYEQLGAFYLGKVFDPDRDVLADDVLLYDAKDLTTHAVIVGMTGSGKTGLGVTLLEEAAIDGIPSLVIDPKGDMGNLLLNFPELRPEDFRPWVEAEQALREGLSPDDYAARTATRWREGLAEWDQPPERIARLRDAAEAVIYTPGSDAGIPIAAFRSLSAPSAAVRENAEAFRERVAAAASALLALLGMDADPIRSREHVLLSNIFSTVWQQGRDLDLSGLIREIQQPPFRQVGVMDLETIFPAADRMKFAVAVNGLLASPTFEAWRHGQPLDIQHLLYTPTGKPRMAVVSIAHLSDAERMFFVTLLLNEVLAWTRSQSGTSSLRAIVYMDEVFGYLPPTANPPSKTPLLTLLKQARAYGVGVVLATQNPVDLDYKALSNAGTWFLGRLQTERDKLRVLDGLEGASTSAGTTFDRQRIERLLSGLKARTFLLNSAHENQPVVYQTRWALSYLRGPLTRVQIESLMRDRKPELAAGRAPAMPSAAQASGAGAAVVSPGDAPSVPAGSTSPPVLPPDIVCRYVAVARSVPRDARIVYRPVLFGAARLHFVDAKSRSNVDVWKRAGRLSLVGDSVPPDVWDAAERVDPESLALLDERPAEGTFAPLPSELAQPRSYKDWASGLKEHFYREESLALFHAPRLKTYSDPDEAEGDFVSRLRHRVREERDLEIEKLKRKFAPKAARLEDRIRRAGQRVEVEKSQASNATTSAVITFGATLLGALFGRKVASATNVSKSATSVRSAGRAVQQRGDIGRAEENVKALRTELAELEAELERETDRIRDDYSLDSIAVESYAVPPRKSDISIEQTALAWLPYRVDAAGIAEPAW